MQRPRVPTDERSRPTRERDQLADRTLHRHRSAFARGLSRTRQIVFSRTAVQNRPHSVLGQSASHAAVAFRRPALRTPTRARIQNREFADTRFLQPPVYSSFGFRTMRELDTRDLRLRADNRRYHGKILLDHMCTTRDHPARVPQARRRLPRLRRPIHRHVRRTSAPRPPTESLPADRPQRRTSPSEHRSKRVQSAATSESLKAICATPASQRCAPNPRAAAGPNVVRDAAFRARIVVQPSVPRLAIRSSHWERHRAELALRAAYGLRRPSR